MSRRPTTVDCLVRWLALSAVGAGILALSPTRFFGVAIPWVVADITWFQLVGAAVILAASVMLLVRLLRLQGDRRPTPVVGSGAVAE